LTTCEPPSPTPSGWTTISTTSRAACEGLHEANPVNLPSGAGVQLELPPTIRWNRKARNWSDHEGTPRARQVSTLIDTLARAIDAWADR